MNEALMRVSGMGRASAGRCRAVWQIVTGVLRELSDEAAYDRHLAATGRTHSGPEWRLFCEERLRRKYQRAKCC